MNFQLYFDTIIHDTFSFEVFINDFDMLQIYIRYILDLIIELSFLKLYEI